MEAPMSSSLGAMGPLLKKLDSLLALEYRLPKPLKDGIELLKEDLEEISAALVEQSMVDSPNHKAKYWMDEVRELSYDTEDCIDNMMRRHTDADAKIRSVHRNRVGRVKISRLSKTPKPCTWIAKIAELRALVREAIERHERYQLDDCASSFFRVFTGHGRVPAVYGRSTNYPVGIDDSKMKLIKWLTNEAERQLKMVSIVGSAGVGKTTLAKELYHELGGQFECQAFVRASRKPDMRRLLAGILYQVQRRQRPCDACTVQNLIDDLREHLQNKRYFIVIDDLWEATPWDIVKEAFPEGNNCSRIITTAEIADVAMECCGYHSDSIFKMKPLGSHDSAKLFFNRVFGSEHQCPDHLKELSYAIIRKCGGLPLATIGIAGLLASQPNISELWDHAQKCSTSNLTNLTLEEMLNEILNLSYNSLPQFVKTCLLYLSMNPQGYIISKVDLMKRWIAEGFIIATEGKDKEEVAGSYLDELINRGMIQPVQINDNGEVLSCTVHQIVLDLLTNKLNEQKFITTIDYCQTKICRFFQLRYLKISSDIIVELPAQIRGLQYLETLEIDARVSAVPLDIVHLPGLLHLCLRDETNLPNGIGCIRSLRTLQYFDLGNNSEDNVRSLGELTNLLDLHLTCSAAPSDDHLKRNLIALASSLGKLRNLKSVSLDPGGSVTCISFVGSSSASSPPVLPIFIKSLCIFSRLPKWTGKLHELRILEIVVREFLRGDINILSGLPALTSLSLYVQQPTVESIVFNKAAFPVLAFLDFRCGILCLAFEEEAMLNLRWLKLVLNAHRGEQYSGMLSGNEHLANLQEIPGGVGAAAGADESDSRAAESAFKDAIRKHPRFSNYLYIKRVDSVEEEYGPLYKQHWTSRWANTWKPNGVLRPSMLEIFVREAPDGPSVMQKDLCSRKKSMGGNLQHTSAEPMKLTYQLLEKLTDCFAEERKLGSGAFGVVYKGVHENGEEIAVKVFHNMAVDDSEFQKEFQNLRRLKHQNIVELKGYCNESEETLMEYEGQPRRVETLHMALCLEYVDNGSLGEHLSDECQGLNWHLRYKIIKGICEGLKYLREGLDEPIWHLDLKPGNILLDKNMVPKIADFGLSRLFGEEETKKTINSVGTCGYWPPEYVKNQVLSNGYDIFSLGVIIVKIMTGREGYSSIADMTRRKFVQHVHNNWRKKLQEILTRSSLEVYCQQVKTCIDIALKCMMQDRHHRPSIQEIVLNLNETETMIADSGLQIKQFHDEEFIFLSKNNSTSKPSSERGGEASRSSYAERRLNRPTMTARELPFHLLKGITDDFSEERLVGCGVYASVYKGVYENGEAVAVKNLNYMPGFHDELFENEIRHLTMVRHLNIVQLIGHCSETRTGVVKYNGKLVSAQMKRRLLCFEYVQNGSLDRYIPDGCSGLEWHTRFGIIRGTCEGLRYLHEGLPSPMFHMNLKPSNILLDEKMVPKIGGFGLSRLLNGERAFVTGRFLGTLRYMPPEFIEKGVISDKTDVYSLGGIILEIIAGYEPPAFDYLSPPEFIEIVLGKWRERLQATLKDTWSVEGYCHQIKKCIEIALKCLEAERLKRPSIGDIVHVLNETETLIHKLLDVHTTELFFPFEPKKSKQDDPELLDVHPTELFFPFEPKKFISCSLQISNKGDDRVAFRLLAKSSRRYLTKLPLCGVVPPRCTYTLALTMRKQPQPPPSNSDDFFTLQSIELRDLDLEDSIDVDYDNFFKESEETAGHEVRKVTLTVACGPAEEATSTQPNQSGIMIIRTQNSRQALSVDVHPTDPWIMTSHHGGNVCIWNYETMATVNSFEVSEEPVNSAKFIVREQWFVAGDGNGYIYVYSYDTEEEEYIIFEAHRERVTSLAVHPTQPYMLSSSDDHLIKLWDWEKGWECTRTFQGHNNRVAHVTFNPNDTNRFISASLDCKAKIWTLDSPDPENTMDGHSADLSCVDYGTGRDRRYLLTGSEDGNAQIWEMETQKCIRKLEGRADRLSAIYWHPELPILTTGSLDGTVRIWNSTTYRLENVISFNLGAVYAFVYIKGLRRIVVGCHQGIAMMEINLQ